MNDDDMSPALRRAALAVHAMREGDRDWVLQELPSVERLMLGPLLEELQAIGIPRDARLLDRPQGLHITTTPPPDAETESLRRLLQAEPLQLSGLVFSTGQWPLARRLAQAVGAHRRVEALHSVDAMGPAPALREAARRAVEQALDDARPASLTESDPAWKRLVNFLRGRSA